MLYREKSFLVENPDEIDRIIYELGQNILSRFKGKVNEKAGEIANFYLIYLFGLRVCEITKYPFNLFANLSKIKIGNEYLYRLKCYNAKAKDVISKTKTVFFYPSNKYEKAMMDFILKNWYKVSYKVMINFAQRYAITEFYAYNREGQEVKVKDHLNIHALRHIRAYVWAKRLGEKLTQRNMAWKSYQMLQYYKRVAKALEEKELETEFINLIKQKMR